MVQGMAFLSKKGFNPQNNTNRKQVWEAQQHSKQEKERLRKRQEQLQKEKEDQELELATRGEIGGSQAQLRFMYDAPPGMETKETKNGNQKSGTQKTSNTNDLSQIQPGDDAAAVAFRQMLAAAAASNGNQDEEAVNDDNNEDANNNNGNFKFTPSLQGSMVEADSRYNKKEGDDANEGDVKKAPSRDSRSALEKEVGRKNRSTQNNLSYEQQIERFPQLKNAPMAVKRGGADGDSDKPMMVHFKPLGSQILHVRCLACGIWGHQKGDRECQKSGWDPFAMPSNKSSSSILPPKRSEKESNHEEKDRRRERSEESDRRRHRRRRRHDNAEDSSVDSFRRRRKKRYKEHYASNDESNSDPSSEDSSKLKRRNDDRYDSSEDERRRRKRRKEKKRSRRHESSSHRKKKKKKRRHSSP